MAEGRGAINPHDAGGGGELRSDGLFRLVVPEGNQSEGCDAAGDLPDGTEDLAGGVRERTEAHIGHTGVGAASLLDDLGGYVGADEDCGNDAKCNRAFLH